MTEIEFLADIAYVAYMETLGVKDLPDFKFTPKVIQDGWVAAVRAVFDNVFIDCFKHHVGNEEEDIHPIFDCVHDPPPFVHSDGSMPSDGAILRDLFKK